MNIDGGQETLCIVIDGLDECATGEFNALAETLANDVPRLPQWLRVLVTSREVPAVTAPLAGAFRMELRAKQEQNLEDIRAYYTEQLEERFGQDPGWESALEILTERSGGIFQYAALVVDGIRKDKMKLTEADTLPEGLAAVYRRWFKWFFSERDMDEYDRVFRPALGMMLAAPEPLPSAELCRVLDWDEDQLGAFIRRINVLLQRGENIFRKETLSFSHAYLSQWLSLDVAAPYTCSRSAGEKRMARGFYALFQKDAKKLTEFEALYLVDLLTRCGETEAAEEAGTSQDLFGRMIDVGDYCNEWGALSLALKYFSQAQGVAEKMVSQRNTYTYEDRRNLITSYNRVALIRGQTGDLVDALEMCKKCLDIGEHQLVSEEDMLDALRDLSSTYNCAAVILQESGNLGLALDLSRKGLYISEQLTQKQNTTQDLQVLSVNYNTLASILQKAGDLDGALEFQRKSLHIAEQLAQKQNTIKAWQYLSDNYYNVVHILRETDDLDSALELCWKTIGIQEPLTQKQNTTWNRRRLYESYNIGASILLQTGKLDVALQLYQKSLYIIKELVEEQNTLQNRRNLSRCYHNIACVLRLTGDLDGALELYGKIIQEQIATQDLQVLSMCYNSIADILKQTGDWNGAIKSYNIGARILWKTGKLDDALELYQKSLNIAEQLAQEENTPKAWQDLCASYEGIAHIREQVGDLDGALELYRKGLNIVEQLVKKQNTLQDRQVLSVIYFDIASILRNTNNLNGALKLYRKSLDIVEGLVRDFGGAPEDKKFLGYIYNEVQEILKQKDDPEAALKLYQRLKDILPEDS